MIDQNVHLFLIIGFAILFVVFACIILLVGYLIEDPKKFFRYMRNTFTGITGGLVVYFATTLSDGLGYMWKIISLFVLMAVTIGGFGGLDLLMHYLEDKVKFQKKSASIKPKKNNELSKKCNSKNSNENKANLVVVYATIAIALSTVVQGVSSFQSFANGDEQSWTHALALLAIGVLIIVAVGFVFKSAAMGRELSKK